MSYNRRNMGGNGSVLLIWLFVLLWGLAAWLTHVVVCIKAASWGFLIAGAIFFPIAWVHGTGLWFGWF